MTWQVEGWDHLMESLEEEQCLLADGFENALVGITSGANPVAVYDVHRMIAIRISEGMTEEEAIEDLEFNTLNAYVGDKTPVYIYLDWARACSVLVPKETP